MDFLDTAQPGRYVHIELVYLSGPCIEMIMFLILVGWTLAAGIRAESVYGQRVRAGVAGIQAEMSSPEKKTV